MSEKTNSKISDQKLSLRSKLWPDLSDEDLWLRKKHTGFTTMPRTLPLLASIMDSLTKNKPVSSTYLDIWCRAFDECFVSLNKHQEMAFHSGFTGQRAAQTWSERIKILAALGFIGVVAGPSGPLSYAVIYNPYKVIKRISKEDPSRIGTDLLNALHERVIEIGAKDLDD